MAGTDYRETLKYGDIVNIGTIGNLTAQTKAKSSNTALSFETVTELTTALTVATWEYSGIAVETIVNKQAMIDMLSKYAPKQGYALDVAVDDVLAGLPDDSTNSVGTLGLSLTYEDVLDAQQYLMDANVELDSIVMTVSPAQLQDWMTLDTFMKSNYNQIHGDPGNTKKSWLGMPVYVSTNVEGSNAAGHDNCMFKAKEAFQLVMQIVPTAHRQFDINYLVDKVVLEQLYGTKIMPDADSVTTYSLSVWMKGL